MTTIQYPIKKTLATVEIKNKDIHKEKYSIANSFLNTCLPFPR